MLDILTKAVTEIDKAVENGEKRVWLSKEVTEFLVDGTADKALMLRELLTYSSEKGVELLIFDPKKDDYGMLGTTRYGMTRTMVDLGSNFRPGKTWMLSRN